MVSEEPIAAETLATWLRPREALRRVQQSLPDIKLAGRIIFEHLQGGAVRAGAKSSSWADSNEPTPPVLLPAARWSQIALKNAAEWWDTGVLRATFYTTYGNRTVRYFGIRLSPSDIDAIVADMPRPQLVAKPREAPVQAKEEKTEAAKGAPVSDAHLRKWHSLYREVYVGPDDTEDNALKSARGMFPGKSVSRDKVRALRGEQKRGPKPKS